LNFHIYDGKSFNKLTTNEIFMKLLENYKDKNHHVYVDRYFTNLKLIKILKENGFYYTGTANCNRRDFPNIKLKLDEIVYFQNNCSNLLVWRSKKKPVHLVTNYHSSNIKMEMYKNRNSKNVLISEKPEAIHYYNKNAKGVDLANRFCSYYKNSHRITRWWKSVFFHFISSTTNNIKFLINKETIQIFLIKIF